LLNYRYVISEAWGSQVAYAVAIGIPTTIFPRDIEIYSLTDSVEIIGKSDPIYVSEKRRVEALFAGYLPELTPEQIDYIHDRLGYEFKNRRWKNVTLVYSLIFRIGFKWFFAKWLVQFPKMFRSRFRK
jgi:hypothetical protein